MLTQYSKKESDCQVVAFFLREKSESFSSRSAMKASFLPSPADETSAPKKRLSAPARSFTREVLFPRPIVKSPVEKNASVTVDVKSRKKTRHPCPITKSPVAKEKRVRGCRCEISEEEVHPRATGKSHKCERKNFFFSVASFSFKRRRALPFLCENGAK